MQALAKHWGGKINKDDGVNMQSVSWQPVMSHRYITYWAEVEPT